MSRLREVRSWNDYVIIVKLRNSADIFKQIITEVNCYGSSLN